MFLCILGGALGAILEIQKDFSRFLASYDFSATEISMDGEVTKFFNGLSDSVSLEEQKKETHEEMILIGNLATTLDNNARQEENEERQKTSGRLEKFILGLAILSLGDFLYSVASDVNAEPSEPWRDRLEMTVSAMIVLGVLAAIGMLVASRKKKKKEKSSHG